MKVIPALLLAMLIVAALLWFWLQPSQPVQVMVCGFENERQALSEKYKNRALTWEEIQQMERKVDDLFYRELEALKQGRCYKEVPLNL